MEENEMITLAQAARETGVPLGTLKKALKGKKKQLLATLIQTPRGPVWKTLRSEAERYAKLYRPHELVKK